MASTILDQIFDHEEALLLMTSPKKKPTKIQLACVRCKRPCEPGDSQNPEARPFKRAEKGLCPNCAVTQFLLCRDLEPLRIGLLRNGIEVLRKPAIQRQFSNILKVGRSDLQADEINWDTVISQWELPWPKGYEP